VQVCSGDAKGDLNFVPLRFSNQTTGELLSRTAV